MNKTNSIVNHSKVGESLELHNKAGGSKTKRDTSRGMRQSLGEDKLSDGLLSANLINKASLT